MGVENVVIAGASGHAKVIVDIFEKTAHYNIVGFLDYTPIGTEMLGYKVIGKEESLPELLKTYPNLKIFIAIGFNWLRHKVMNKIIQIVPNIEFVNAIHPSAIIGKQVTIGKGVAIMAGAIINSDSEIGNFTIINTKASVDHDNKIADFVSLAPNSTTGGNVIIGKYSIVAIGATIRNNITIGDNALIGAGAVLLKNCDDNSIMYGVPAKEITKREFSDIY